MVAILATSIRRVSSLLPVGALLISCNGLLGNDTHKTPNTCQGKKAADIAYHDCGQGVCAVLFAECKSERPTACAGGDPTDQTPEEECGASGLGDGLDNDCNGVVDDGCECKQGTAPKSCYPYSKKTQNVGLCKNGSQVCDPPYWSSKCEGAVTPVKEKCGNGFDDDCDRYIDEDCTCTPGQTQDCYSGPVSTLHVGRCTGGTQTCQAEGRWGDCVNEIAPKFEACDGEDNDCNGDADDNPNCCRVDKDCPEFYKCTNGVCETWPRCDDKSKNGDETDVDCGGSCSTKCLDGKGCNQGPDCVSKNCVSNLCVRKKLGQACESDVECEKEFCVDGFCCSEKCDAPCYACSGAIKGNNEDGTCGPVVSGRTSGNDCLKDQTNPCGRTGFCDGQGQCQYPLKGAQCGAGACIGDSSSLDPGAYCDGAGVCLAQTPVACAPKNCVANECKAVCALDADCSPRAYCDLTLVPPSCTFQRDNGLACKADKECQSGNCIDGYCCNTRCTETCKACDVSGSVGICSFVAPAQTNKTCTGQEACNGSGQCVGTQGITCNLDNECLTGHCVDHYCCDTACAAPCQSCNVPGYLGTCTAIPASYPDDAPVCDGDFRCNGTGECRKQSGLGCAKNEECVTTACSLDDATCCGTTCDGVCQTCNGSTPGKCEPLPKGTIDNQHKCGTTEGRACDGSGKCKYANGYDKCTVNEDCASGNCSGGVCCDKACDGRCETCNLAGSVGQCRQVIDGSTTAKCSGDYACGANGCLKLPGKSASGDDACLSGFAQDGVCCKTRCKDQCQTCVTGECQAVKGHDDDDTCRTADGSTCNDSGVCLRTLGSSCVGIGGSACASGHCVDGVCCEQTSCPTCYACSVGGDGKCAPVPSSSPATGDCASVPGGKCDGKGVCVISPGSRCEVNSGYKCAENLTCADGYCCDNPCGNVCSACNLPNNQGHCIPISSGEDDLCKSTDHKYCSGGECFLKHPPGWSCGGDASICQTGFCTDGVCCLANDCGACKHCSATSGQCDNSHEGLQDRCGTDQTCHNGACFTRNGGYCTDASQCLDAKYCTDFACCEEACTKACHKCDSFGKCVPDTSLDKVQDSCVDGSICDNSGECKRDNGQPCESATQCRSQSCVPAGDTGELQCCDRGCTGPCEKCIHGTCVAIDCGLPGRCKDNLVCDGNIDPPNSEPTNHCLLPTGAPCTPGPNNECLSHRCSCTDPPSCTSFSCAPPS